MSAKQPIVVARHHTSPASFSQYLIGFVLSVLLTLTAFLLAIHESVTEPEVLIALISLALLQLVVQLQFFIHLDHESGPKWNKLIFWFMALVVFIVVGGSLWIMTSLDYHHDTAPADTDEYIMQQENIER